MVIRVSNFYIFSQSSICMIKMFKYIIPFLVLCNGTVLSAQVKFSYNQVSLQPGQSISKFCVDTSNSAVITTLFIDDFFTDIIPIGFNFKYFGNIYNKCLLADNGFLSFNLEHRYTNAPFYWNQSQSWVKLKNSILVAFMDLYIPANGHVQYQTKGAPGNRYFIAEWCGISKYGGTDCYMPLVTMQIVLYESDNTIELNVLNLSGSAACPPTNTMSKGVQGLTDPNLSNPIYAPGKAVADMWGNVGGSNNVVRFIPNGSGYNIDTNAVFDYKNIVLNSALANIKWYNNLSNSIIDSGVCTQIVHNPEVEYYVAKLEGFQNCNGDIITSTDTLWVNSLPGQGSNTREATTQLLKIYPNPTNDIIYLNGTLPSEQIKLTDMSGRTLWLQKTNLSEFKNFGINLKTLPSGTYWLFIQNKEKVLTYKVQKW